MPLFTAPSHINISVIHSGAYWHHAIVEDIDHAEDEIHAIEYSNNAKRFITDNCNTAKGFITDNCTTPKAFKIAEVIRQTYKFGNEDVYLLKHDSCDDPEKVVSRAQSKLGEGKYNPVTNNCEHFAMWCKTGKSSSDQVNKAKEMLQKPSPSQIMVAIGAAIGAEVVKTGVSGESKEDVAQTKSNEGQEVVKTDVSGESNEDVAQTKSNEGQEVVKTDVSGESNEDVAQTKSNEGQEVVKTDVSGESKKDVAQTVSNEGQEVVNTTMRAASDPDAVAQTASNAGQQVVMKEFVAQPGLNLSNEGQEVVNTTMRAASDLDAVAQTVIKEFVAQPGLNPVQIITETVAREATEKVVTRTASEAGREVVKTGVRETSQEVVTQSAAVLGGALVVGALCGAAFEGALIYRDICSVRADMKRGNIDEYEFETAVQKRVITGAGDVGGSTVGAVIGQFVIPVPILGGTIGAILGGFTGKFFGNIAANSLL